MVPTRNLLPAPSTHQIAWRLLLATLLCALAFSAAAELGLGLRDTPNGAGAEVTQVMPGSVAAQAGLKAGDIILQVEKDAVTSAEQLAQRVKNALDNKPITIRISREGWERDLLLQPPGPLQLPPARAEMSLDEAAHKAYAAELDLADASYRSANWPDAERHYRLAIQLVPSDPANWGRLGHALIMQQKFREAVGACNQSLALGGPQAATLNNLGYSHFKLGALSEAKTAYLRAVELSPQWALPYSGLGAVYLTQQDWAQAEKYYRLALARDPGNAADQQALEGSLRMQRHVSEVQQMPPASNQVPPSVPESPMRTAGQSPQQPSPQVGTVSGRAIGPAETVPDGRKAIIAVGDFQVKAAGAGQFIGDGMREMLVTALHNSGNYVVVERMDLPGLAAEQALSRSRMARPGTAIGESQMDVAEVLVYAAVTEFESDARGGGIQFGIPNLPLNLGRQTKTAHMAIDMRVVDVATGRLIAAQRIPGEAKSSQTSVGTVLSVGGTSIPTSLGAFKNTPMEQAIRECIQKATAYITHNTPAQYFRHQ